MSTTMKREREVLPNDVLLEIFNRLPLKSLVKLQLVCKRWKFLASNPQFLEDFRIHQQGNNNQLILSTYSYEDKKSKFYSIEQSDLVLNNETALLETPLLEFSGRCLEFRPQMLGSYNGLVAILCLHDSNHVDSTNSFILWNPLTKQCTSIHVSLDTGLAENLFDGNSSLFGLCYDNYSDSYLAVAMACNRTKSQIRKSAINTGLMDFGDGRYTELQLPPLSKKCFIGNQIGTVVCGVPHWVVKLYNFRTRNYKEAQVITYFDFETERFRSMAMPQGEEKGRKIVLGLGALGGQRQLSITLRNEAQGYVEIWVMKEYGKKESWTKLFDIQDTWPFQYCRKVLGVMKNGEFLIDMNTYDRTTLFGYDPEKGSSKEIKIMQDGSSSLSSLIQHEHSLIAPPHPRSYIKKSKSSLDWIKQLLLKCGL